MAKVLRVLSLTAAAGMGSKATQLTTALKSANEHQGGLAHGLQQMQLIGKVDPIPTKPGRGQKALPQSKLGDRYSLRWEGAVFYSLAVHLDCVVSLQTRCMHSLVNLRPVCSNCNSSRQNPLKFANGLWWK